VPGDSFWLELAPADAERFLESELRVGAGDDLRDEAPHFAGTVALGHVFEVES
jgi:hypothetical protein